MENHQFTKAEILHMWRQIVDQTGVDKYSHEEWQEHYENFVRCMLSPSEPYVQIDSIDNIMNGRRIKKEEPKESKVTQPIDSAASSSKKSSKKKERKMAKTIPVVTPSSSSELSSPTPDATKAPEGHSDDSTSSGSVMSPMTVEYSDNEVGNQEVQRNANNNARKKSASKRHLKSQRRAYSLVQQHMQHQQVPNYRIPRKNQEYAPKQKQQQQPNSFDMDGPSTSTSARPQPQTMWQKSSESKSNSSEGESQVNSGEESVMSSPNDSEYPTMNDDNNTNNSDVEQMDEPMDQQEMDNANEKNPEDTSDDDFESNDVFTYIDSLINK